MIRDNTKGANFLGNSIIILFTILSLHFWCVVGFRLSNGKGIDGLVECNRYICWAVYKAEGPELCFRISM